MDVERYDNGIPSWVDVTTPDLDASRAFYGALLGWECPVGAPEAGGYSVCELGGKTVAGVGPQMNPDFPPAWLTYVNVDSADDTVAKITAAGGMVFAGPMDVMDAGRLAIFADPVGAVLGLWEPKSHMGAQVVNEPGAWCWSELVTTDLSASKAFYDAVFGWGAQDFGPGGENAYTEWKVGERSVGGMMPKRPDMPAEAPPFWGVYFAVDDADATAAKAQELGGALFMGPMDIEPGRMAVLGDPLGVMFNILKLKS